MAGGAYMWVLPGDVASHSIGRVFGAPPACSAGFTRKMCSWKATYKYLPSVEMPGQLSPARGAPQADSTKSSKKATPTKRWRGTDNTFTKTPSRNRIVASRVKWVAAQDAFEAHPRTS